MAKRRKQKYPAEDVPLLLMIAKDLDSSNEPDRYTIIGTNNDRMGWLKSLSKIEARDELEYRFRSIVATLVNVCITGRPNFWSSYQITFLKMFASKSIPIHDTAGMLKRNLMGYEKEELFSTGQLAVLLAIEKCETNFASTIVMCFKDLIHRMTKDPSNKTTEEIDVDAMVVSTMEDELAISMFLDTLSPKELECAQKIIDGEKVKDIPKSLVFKFESYLGGNNESTRTT